MATRLANATRSAAADAIGALPNGGVIEVRTGGQPATAEDAETGTLLVSFTLAADAFDAAVNGVAALAGVPIAATGVGDGTAGWFRMKTSGAATVLDGSVGTSGAQLNLNTLTISTGVDVEITSGSLTMPAA